MRIEPSDSIHLSLSTATQVIVSRPCIVQGVVLSPGSAASTISLIDPSGQGVQVTTSGTVKVQMAGVANGASIPLGQSGSGIAFQNGCIAVVTGTGAQATVIYAVI